MALKYQEHRDRASGPGDRGQNRREPNRRHPESLEERLECLNNNRRSQALTAQIDDILQRVDAMPDLDARTPEEIIGYDEDGLPS